MTKKTKGKKVIVVMPAYNAEKTLKKTYDEVPKSYVDEFILVDDVSKDKTAEISRKLGIKTIVHEKNKGYGGNQKTCYDNALKDGADIVVLLHPDYQYDPKILPDIIKPIVNNQADVVYGSRTKIKGNAKKGGMPLYKRIGNKILTFVFNIMLGTKLTDAATGYIAYSRKVLESIPYHLNHDGFEFDEEAIIQIAARKFRITEIPIPCKYEKESSTISIKKSIKYGISLMAKIMRYKLHQIGIKNYKLVTG